MQMGKINLKLISSIVGDEYSKIGIIFNGIQIEDNLQLSNEIVEVEYEVNFNNDQQILTINLLNHSAIDYNQNGTYGDEVDETMKAIVTHISILKDSQNKIILPQSKITYVVPEGFAESGQIITLSPEILNFISYGENYTIVFNDEKIISINDINLTYFEIIDDNLYQNGELIDQLTPV